MPRTCGMCGRVIPPGQAGCGCADGPGHDWLHSREMESAATAHCGPPVEVEDEALARIAQRTAGRP